MSEQYNANGVLIGTHSEHNNMSLLVDVKGEMTDASIDFDVPLMPYQAFLDIEKFPNVCQFVTETGLGSATGVCLRQNFVSYPLYHFDREKLYEICPDAVRAYEEVAPMDELRKIHTLEVEDITDVAETIDDVPFGWEPEEDEYDEENFEF